MGTEQENQHGVNERFLGTHVGLAPIDYREFAFKHVHGHKTWPGFIGRKRQHVVGIEKES